MREMKDSGIEWVGEIPFHWTINRIKYILAQNDGGVWGDDPIDGMRNEKVLRSTEQTIDGKWDIQDPAERRISNPSPYRIKDGDLLITKSSGSSSHIGKTTLATETEEKAGYLYSNFLQRLHTNKEIFPKYLWYLLNSQLVREQFVWMQNSTIGIGNINAGNINEVRIPFPRYEEQYIISAFLDSKCAEIDALSADIQSEIDTLEAYKRSVITEAVTKGLDKNVPMKDSGMPWVGNVPHHWLVEKVKYHLTRYEPRNPGNQQVLSVYREYGVIPKDSRDDNHNVTSEDTSKYKYVKQGNLVINKMKAWQGSMGVSDHEGIVSPAYFIYHFTDTLLVPKYLHYLFRSCYKDEFRRISGGIREGQWDLSPEAFANTLILLPPVNEQDAIVDVVDKKTTEIEAIIAQKQEQLAVLADYKKSIIYEYVTGKKEVPVA